MFPEEKILREVIRLQEKIDALHFDIKLVKKNNINMGDKRILDVFDVALFLKVSDRHVTRLVTEGKLKGFKLGKRRLFALSEIIEYLNSLPR